MMRDRHGGNRVDTAQGEDAKLRHLLGVEDRLQALVRAAEEEAARQVARALAARSARLADARRDAEREDEAQAVRDAAAQEASLSAIARANEAAVTALRDIPGARIDALARWALEQAIDDHAGGAR